MCVRTICEEATYYNTTNGKKSPPHRDSGILPSLDGDDPQGDLSARVVDLRHFGDGGLKRDPHLASDGLVHHVGGPGGVVALGQGDKRVLGAEGGQQVEVGVVERRLHGPGAEQELQEGEEGLQAHWDVFVFGGSLLRTVHSTGHGRANANEIVPVLITSDTPS